MSTYYFLPTRNVFGMGASQEAGELMKSLGGHKTMIVTDKFLHESGMAGQIQAILAQAGEVWAFPGTKPGTHKTRQAVWKDVKRAAKAFRLPQNIGTHSFRKVYAVRLREKYGSIAKVQRALAHSSLAVTAVYAMADALLSDSQQRRERQRAQRRTVET